MKRYHWKLRPFVGCLSMALIACWGVDASAQAPRKPNPLRAAKAVKSTSTETKQAEPQKAEKSKEDEAGSDESEGDTGQESTQTVKQAVATTVAKPAVSTKSSTPTKSPTANTPSVSSGIPKSQVVQASGNGPELFSANPRLVSKNSVLVSPNRTMTINSRQVDPAAPMQQVGPMDPMNVAPQAMPNRQAPIRQSAPPPATMGEVIQGEPLLMGDAYPEEYLDDTGCGIGCGTPCCLIPCPIFSLDTLQVFGGAQGFTGPPNRGETGSFGFNEGFNWGGPVAGFDWFSVQLGFRATQDNLAGALSTSESRNQIFVTGGVFRRVDWGLQGGVVLDYLSDSWYYNVNLLQMRSELSWMFPCNHELGFWFTAGLNSSSSTSTLDRALFQGVERWEPTDIYAFYYRRRFDECSQTEGRFYAGFTGASDGILGADLRMPMNDRFAVSAGATYLIPHEGEGVGLNFGHAQESWNVGVNLIWYPGCGGSRSNSYYRPLFNVADNGSFMVDRDN